MYRASVCRMFPAEIRLEYSRHYQNIYTHLYRTDGSLHPHFRNQYGSGPLRQLSNPFRRIIQKQLRLRTRSLKSHIYLRGLEPRILCPERGQKSRSNPQDCWPTWTGDSGWFVPLRQHCLFQRSYTPGTRRQWRNGCGIISRKSVW